MPTKPKVPVKTQPQPYLRITQLYTAEHHGIDLATNIGRKIKAPVRLVIERTGWMPKGYGNYIYARDVYGNQLRFGHLAQPTALHAGQTVTPGQLLGFVGSTGRSTGPHLHLEVRSKSLAPIDPRSYFQGLPDETRLFGGIGTQTGSVPKLTPAVIPKAQNYSPQRTTPAPSSTVPADNRPQYAAVSQQAQASAPGLQGQIQSAMENAATGAIKSQTGNIQRVGFIGGGGVLFVLGVIVVMFANKETVVRVAGQASEQAAKVIGTAAKAAVL